MSFVTAFEHKRSLASELLALCLSPLSFFTLLFHLSFNSICNISICIYMYMFSVHVSLDFSFLALSFSLFFFFFFPSTATRPPILLTNARNLSAPPVHRNPPFLLYSESGGPLPTLFSFSSFLPIPPRYYPLSLAFGAPPRQ